MKKLIALITLTLVVVTANVATAQVTFDMKSGYSLTTDTVTNTGSNYVKISFQDSYKYMSIQPVVTKVSGTITSNTNVKLQGSIDGTNWVSITGDTLNVTNQTTNTTIWKLDAAATNPYYYFRCYYVGYGTMVATLKAKVLFRKSE